MMVGYIAIDGQGVSPIQKRGPCFLIQQQLSKGNQKRTTSHGKHFNY
jgi:hypothetical protein